MTEEKVLIKSVMSKKAVFIGAMFSALIFPMLINVVLGILELAMDEYDYYKAGLPHGGMPMMVYWLLVVLVFVEIFFIFFFLAKKTNVVVTNRRVTITTIFKAKHDMPIENITSTNSGMSILSFHCSGTTHAAYFVANSDEILDIVNRMIAERTAHKDHYNTYYSSSLRASSVESEVTPNKTFQHTDVSSLGNSSNQGVTSIGAELKKYKDLLDDGLITQEEYDAKKKQLIDL